MLQNPQALELSLLLLKQQVTFGSAEASLAAADLMETIGPPTLKWDPGNTEVPLVAGEFSQDPMIPGLYSYELGLSVHARAAAAGDTGQFGKLLKMSGMLEVESPSDTFTYTFSSNLDLIKDFTAWCYSGHLATNKSILRKAFNGIFAPKFTIEGGKPTVAEFTSKMGFYAIPAVGTQPSITKQRTNPPAAMNTSTLSLGGDSDYGLLSCEIDPQQQIALSTNLATTYGMGRSAMTNRKIKFKAKVYKDIPSVVDPYTALNSLTEGALTIEHGTAPQKIKYTGTYSKIDVVGDSEEGGIECWDLEGSLIRNDFSIVMTTA